MGPGAGPSALGNVYRQAGGFPEHGGRRKRSRRDPFFDASIAAGVSAISFNESGSRGAGTIKDLSMQIRVGYELIYECPQPTPMILNLNVHYSRASDIVIPDFMTTDPSVPITAYRDGFGNWCTRIVAPQGRIRIASTGVVRDSGEPDEVAPSAGQHLVQDLPEESLV